MDSCCENKAGELAQLRSQQSRVLYIVLAINAGMFLFEFIAGWIIGSTAVLADSLDMFGDASVYALTLYVLHRSARTRAGAALFKGSLMLLFGLLVIVDAVRKLFIGGVPEPQWMGLIGIAALVANTVCFILLYRHRSDDLNMKSTFLCSRNDLIANSSVIVAAILVGVTGTLWPDVIVGLAIAALFLHSARQVLTESWAEWRGAAGMPSATATSNSSDDCCTSQPSDQAQSSCATKAASHTRANGGCCQPEPVEAQAACCSTMSTSSYCEESPTKGTERRS